MTVQVALNSGSLASEAISTASVRTKGDRAQRSQQSTWSLENFLQEVQLGVLFNGSTWFSLNRPWVQSQCCWTGLMTLLSAWHRVLDDETCVITKLFLIFSLGGMLFPQAAKGSMQA